jgi:hypothetical protein
MDIRFLCTLVWVIYTKFYSANFSCNLHEDRRETGLKPYADREACAVVRITFVPPCYLKPQVFIRLHVPLLK